jgi:hypothetical protein
MPGSSPMASGFNLSFTIGRYRCPRSMVPAILGVRVPPPKSAARIPTVAWT